MIRRHIDLIRMLIEQNEYKPASFFSEALHVSSKTIYSDINELEGLTKQYGLELVKIPRSGIILQGSLQQKEKLLNAIRTGTKNDEYSKEYRRIQIVKRLLIDVVPLSLEELSTEFIVSKTSLYNDIASINTMMDESDIRISIAHEGIEYDGRESRIQRCIEKFIRSFAIKSGMDTDDLIVLMFDKDIIEVIDKLLYTDYADLTESVSDYYIRGLRLSMIILLSRLSKGYHLEKEEQFLFNSLKFMETFIVANTMVEQIQQSLDIHFDNEDTEYLCQQLFAHRITSKIKTGDPKYEKTVQTIIERMEEIEKVNFSQDERLYKSLLYHIPAMIIRLQKGVQVQNPLLESIKSQYTKLFTVVWYALSFIESEYDLMLNDDEVSLILIYFQLSLEKLAKTRNIIVVCPYGTSSSQLILNRVKNFLPARDHIEVSNVSRLNRDNLSNVDLIITPVDIPKTGVPTVKVSPLISDTDLTSIMQMYTNCVLNPEKNQWKSRLSQVEMPTVSQYASAQLIHIQCEYATKEECLDDMISELERLGYVKDSFRISIFNREKMGSTGLGTGAALPHADPDTILVPSISLTTLKRPIQWGDVHVSLIVMVALPESEINQFSAVISELYQVIDKREKVDEIVRMDAVSTVMQLFQK